MGKLAIRGKTQILHNTYNETPPKDSSLGSITTLVKSIAIMQIRFDSKAPLLIISAI